MEALREIWKSIFAWKIWIAIGVEDVVGRYRRTVLGPVWLVLSQCAFIFGIYFVHRSVLGGGDDNFLVFLSISLPGWTLINMFVNDGCTAFLRSKGYIESYPLPLPIYVIRTVVSAVVTVLHMIPIYIVLAIVFKTPLTWSAFAVVPALIVLILFGLGAGLGLASIAARFRDVGAALAAFMQLMFVLSPVFWEPTAQQKESLYVILNPFYYLLEVLREPLLGHPLTPEVWFGAVAVTLVTLLGGIFSYCAMRPTVVYWL